MKYNSYKDITVDKVVKMHLNGYSITEIKDKINKEYREAGDERRITIQSIMYRIRVYEKENNVTIYKAGKKGRKKLRPTLFD